MSKSLALATLMGLALCASITPSRAEACLNAILVRLSTVTQRLDRADRELHRGRTSEALADARWVVSVADGRSHSHELELTNRADEARVGRLLENARSLQALAVVRLEGRVDRHRWAPTSRLDEATRWANLSWARDRLAQGARSGEVVRRARHAEALARFEASREQAREILAELARTDRMPDAWGYRVLAELSEQRGDTASRNAALARCHDRAGADGPFVCPRLVATR